jgi:AAA domain
MSTQEQARPSFRPTPSSSNGDGPDEPTPRDQYPGGRLQQKAEQEAERKAYNPTEADKIGQRVEEITAELRSMQDNTKDPRFTDLWSERAKLRNELADMEAQAMLDSGAYQSPGDRLVAVMRLDAARYAQEQLGKDTGKLVFTSAADITPERVEWVWHHRLPLGTFSLSAGKGGAAKSLHAIWLATMSTLGRLPGCWKGKPRGVLWVTLEASHEKEVVPRLIAAGADLDLVHFATVQSDDDPANDHIKIFNPAYIDGLRKIVQAKDIGMIVLDPALDVLDGTIKTNDQIEVRQAISRIQAFAEELEILILGIAHFNKMNSVNDAIDRITGSAAFSQRVRAAIVFAYNEDDDCFVISQGKNNWGPLRQPNLAFTAEPRTVGDGVETIRLKWANVDYEHSVGDLLEGKHKAKTTKLDQAIAFLEEELKDGPVLRSVIIAKANEEKIRQSTLERAYRELGVQIEKPSSEGISTGRRGAPPILWKLPES